VLRVAQNWKAATFSSAIANSHYPVTLLSGSVGNGSLRDCRLHSFPGDYVHRFGANPSALVAKDSPAALRPDLAVVFDDPKAHTFNPEESRPGKLR